MYFQTEETWFDTPETYTYFIQHLAANSKDLIVFSLYFSDMVDDYGITYSQSMKNGDTFEPFCGLNETLVYFHTHSLTMKNITNCIESFSNLRFLKINLASLDTLNPYVFNLPSLNTLDLVSNSLMFNQVNSSFIFNGNNKDNLQHAYLFTSKFRFM